MKFTEFLNANISRKAEVVIVTIAALVFIGRQGEIVLSAEQVELVKWSIVAISIVGLVGIIAQAILDFKHPKNDTGE